ncbi:tRNA pseudouridine(55) synthase TruB [Patescibacteria group bacterium]|nr:tRNA pseudouridine(55) synthase TruB [Patescibacteria group bacterium]
MKTNNIDQVLVVNKPQNWTSYDVVHKIKAELRKSGAGKVKVGHAGTLDPLATGVLLVLIGSATKKQAQLMKLDKEYLSEITFGQVRDTYDSEGKIVQTADSEDTSQLSRKQVEKELTYFRGEIDQRVPAYSAVKIKGKRLYKLARRGEVRIEDLPVKKVTVCELELLNFTPYRKKFLWIKEKLPTARIRLVCSSGTYVRSLAHDWGQRLGVGGFVSQITRTRVGPYTLKKAKSVQEIVEKISKS